MRKLLSLALLTAALAFSAGAIASPQAEPDNPVASAHDTGAEDIAMAPSWKAEAASVAVQAATVALVAAIATAGTPEPTTPAQRRVRTPPGPSPDGPWNC